MSKSISAPHFSLCSQPHAIRYVAKIQKNGFLPAGTTRSINFDRKVLEVSKEKERMG